MALPANLRGWGPGWPTNRQADMVPVVARISHATWWVHKEIAPLIQFLVDEVERRGYLFDHGPDDVDDDWGYANRPIRGKKTPSNHSWGLAIDIDAQNYPMGTRRFPPAWIVTLFEAYGFEWGGRWTRPDPMHFEFKGSITEARFLVAMLAAAHAGETIPNLPPLPQPLPAKEEEMAQSDNTIIHIIDPPSDISTNTWFLFNGFRAMPLSSAAKANALHRVGVANDVILDEAGNVRPKPMTWGEFNGTEIVSSYR